MMKTPIVFISYSHDSDSHKEWVLQLATDLRTNGVDATCDEWDLSPGQDIAAFMQNQITTADRVLLVCTEGYVRKSEQGAGGVPFEKLIITSELVQNTDTKKFIPLVRANPGNRLPAFLGARRYIDFSTDRQYQVKLDELLRELLGMPSKVKPPLGLNPFSGAIPTSSPVRTVGPTGLASGGRPFLDDEWFQTQAFAARSGISKLGLDAFMEIRMGLHDSLGKSQIELLNAVRSSEIRTFGWPIAVTLDNRDEYRPRPYQDGIRAEIAITEKEGFSGEPSYDYWAVRNTGDFYLLQSLFEDSRAKRKLFFNTRIVRVTEALLFGANFYGNLGAPPETRLSVRIGHYGLADRELTSSSPRRFILPRISKENQSETSVTAALGEIRSNLVDHVKRIVSPLFLLFDFQDIPNAVYQDIIRRFQNGEVS